MKPTLSDYNADATDKGYIVRPNTDRYRCDNQASGTLCNTIYAVLYEYHDPSWGTYGRCMVCGDVRAIPALSQVALGEAVLV